VCALLDAGLLYAGGLVTATHCGPGRCPRLLDQLPARYPGNCLALSQTFISVDHAPAHVERSALRPPLICLRAFEPQVKDPARHWTEDSSEQTFTRT
jgi:hypothetical protein